MFGTSTIEDTSALEKKIALPEPEKELIRDFYHRTISRFAGQHLQKMQDEVRLIVVGHLVPTLPFFLEALSKIGTIAAVIKKGSVPDVNITDWLTRWLPEQRGGNGTIVDQAYFKEQKAALIANIRGLSSKKIERLNLPLDEKGKVQEEKLGIRELLAVSGPEFIKQWVGDKKGIIIDIGGYFAHSVEKLQIQKSQKGGIIGIVEDTENGHQLYEKAILRLRRGESKDVPPIITVARSQIKDSEDYNVGKAITDAVDHILRTAEYTHLAESKTILIVGYGKIGSAAAKVASEKTRGSVLICEIDPVRRLKASSHSFPVVELEKGLTQADVIICCTGKKCLTSEHLSMIKNNAYIASCTSRDGEFDETFLSSLNKISVYEENKKAESPSEGEQPGGSQEKKPLISTISRYTIAGKTINLLNDGNSVNFVEKAVHGYFIHGVLASLAAAAIKLYLESPFDSGSCGNNILKNGELNDFNELIESREGLHYQSVIADILMQEKLRKEPALTNYQRSSARYLPRDKYVKNLNLLLNKQEGGGRVHITGGKKYGKSQIIEEFFALHGSRYDIVWKFDALSPLEAQFKQFASTINSHPIVKKIGEIKFEKVQEELSYSPWRRASPTKSTQVSIERQQILKKLEETDLSYLLIFEDIDLLPEADGLNTPNLQKYLPKPSKSKREHIICTSGDKVKGTFVAEANFDYLTLEPFPTVKLFKFLINDDAIWRSEKESELSRLAYSFVYPMSSLDDYQGGEIAHQDEGYDIFVALSNVFSSFMRNHKDYDWQQLITGPRPKEGYITQFLKIVLNELDDATKKLLLLFYVINFEEVVCSVERAELIKFLRKVLDSPSASEMKKLLECGLIEDKNGSMNPVLTRISARGSSDELLHLIQDSFIDKEGLHAYKVRCQEFIVALTVKQFCNDYQVSLLPMVEKIAKFLNESQDGSFYQGWKENFGKLYCALLKKLGDFYLESNNYHKSMEYYRAAKSEYLKLLEEMNAFLMVEDLSGKYPVATKECTQVRDSAKKKLEKIDGVLSKTRHDDYEGMVQRIPSIPKRLSLGSAVESGEGGLSLA